jgi:maltose alpha-D-glucosyltransferase/alpha-amylase
VSAQIEAQLLEWLPKRRWFRAKSRTVSRVRVEDMVPLGGVSLFFVAVEHDGGTDDYVVALGFDGGIHDVLGEPAVAASMLDLFGTEPRRGVKTTVKFDAMPAFTQRRLDDDASFAPKAVTTEQTNTSIIYGNSFVLKILRQLDEGLSPDLEMGEFLTLAGYEHAPALAGTITVERPGRLASTLGVLHRFTPNRGDAWTFTLAALRASSPGPFDPDYPSLAELLGRRVGQMHTALASRTDLPHFKPEPLSRDRRAAMVTAVEHSLDRALAAVARTRGQVAVPGVHERLAQFVNLPSDPIATRVHGDLHLGQVLVTIEESGTDFALIDFEGEPGRPLAHRKAKRPPFVDVAGMIRSFHYAAMTVARETGDNERALAWYRTVRAAFLRGWRSAAEEPAHAEVILDYCLLEKCVYEVNYEADNRPDWLDIPLAGLIGE